MSFQNPTDFPFNLPFRFAVKLTSKNSKELFSDSYVEARDRLLLASAAVGADVTSHEVVDWKVAGLDGVGWGDVAHEPLMMDVVSVGPMTAPTLLVSSGVHGVEGFLGSAIQLGMLRAMQQIDVRDLPLRLVLLHAVNPFGFHFMRRFDESGIDLNRNFLADGESYSGAHSLYRELNPLLNPGNRPRRGEAFKLRALWKIIQYGMQPLKEAIAGGQYEFPDGLFFGGHGPSRSKAVIEQYCDYWVGEAKETVHIDIHSGLGPYADCKLLLSTGASVDTRQWHEETFGKDAVESGDESQRTAYSIRGEFGEWMENRFDNYRFALAEFGTYGNIRVLKAMRDENRLFHFGDRESKEYLDSRSELLECFCPADDAWRVSVIDTGLSLMDQVVSRLLERKS